MKKHFLFLVAVVALLSSCKKSTDQPTPELATTKVLLLKVNYATNIFEEGKELVLAGNPATFTPKPYYQAPGDFGSIKIVYDELGDTLFNGSIIWMGLGSISYPQNFTPASQFNRVLTNDMVYPDGGFNIIFNPYPSFNPSFNAAWAQVQSLTKVREYIQANPGGKAHLFVYTPDVSIGNPNNWSWIIMLKK